MMAMMYMLFPGGAEKAVTLSYDDGVPGDIRLVSILRQHGLKGTFNLNSGCFSDSDSNGLPYNPHRRLSVRELNELFSGSEMEIAVHGLTHPQLHRLDSAVCTYEILEDRKNLEKQFHTIIGGMAYPYGACSSEVIACAKMCGIVYARTCASTHSFDLPDEWMRWNPTCHHKDPMLQQLTERFINDDVTRDARIFYLWGHSYEFDDDQNWESIENFAKAMSEPKNIWHATNMEIYSYIQAYQGLRYSADGSCLCNPSASTVCFRVKYGTEWKKYAVNPGETLVLS